MVIEVGLGPLRGQVCVALTSPLAPKESCSGFVTNSSRSGGKKRKEEREDSKAISGPISKMEAGAYSTTGVFSEGRWLGQDDQ